MKDYILPHPAGRSKDFLTDFTGDVVHQLTLYRLRPATSCGGPVRRKEARTWRTYSKDMERFFEDRLEAFAEGRTLAPGGLPGTHSSAAKHKEVYYKGSKTTTRSSP